MNRKSFRGILVFVICIIYLIPFYVLTTISFKSPQDISSKWIMPNHFYLGNFTNAWKDAWLGNALLNDVIITVFAVALIIVLGACASYPLARYKTRFNRFIYSLIISCMIVPQLTILVPLYKIMADIRAINQYWGIILLHVTFFLPLTVFLYTGFISTIPKELDEAALIDGCSKIGVFFRIIFPLLKTITAAVTILAGCSIWNDYQFSIFFLNKREVMTVTVALSQFISQFQNNLNWVAAGCFIGMFPLAILYLSLQKYFVKGMVEGAVKG
jgi:raffinose/stachyose/melibiose transport system permease protein